MFMKTGIFADSITEASIKIIAASLPFITMGLIGHPALLIAAGSTGGVFLFVFLIRTYMLTNRYPKRMPLLDNIMNGLLFPYVFALSFGIGIAYGERNGWYGVWFSLFLACFVIIGACVSKNKNSDNA